MAQLELAFSNTALGQSENLKIFLANGIYGNSTISDFAENSGSVSLKKGEFELLDANAILFYLANTSTTSSQLKTLAALRSALFDIETLDKATFSVEDLPSFPEPVATDPFQLAVFASLYPFYAAKFKFVGQYKWFSKFFKVQQVYAEVKRLKNHTFAVISATAKKNNSSKPRGKGKKENVVKRVISVEKTGQRVLTNAGKSLVKEEINGVIVPKEGKKNILITSALPYVNNVPHLGNVVGSVLSADVFARYVKSKRDYNVLFVGGTDEYGTATETKALEDKTTPRALCDKYHPIHRDIYKWFDIEFDFFGRTTTELQTEISLEIFLDLYKNGYLLEQTIQQLYCDEHKGFLADRYVTGECPKCHDPKAKGDQCDTCGSLLSPLELINPKCKLDGHKPVPRSTEHIYLDLDKLEPETKAWIEKQSVEGGWTQNTKNITKSWLDDGLRPIGITRDLTWGSPVPLEKYKNKVLYVWFDATIGYVSITANYFKNHGETDSWKLWWKNPDNVKLYQFMGKDNVTFHLIIFPASLIGTKKKWTKNYHIDTTEYLQYEGGKFLKSEKVGVFGDQAKETGVPASVWRYYLINVRPESGDTQFSWDDFVARNNSELLKNLGNLTSRLVKFVNTSYKGVVPVVDEAKFESLIKNYKGLVTDLNLLLEKYNKLSLLCKEKEALSLAMAFSSRGNEFLQDNKLDNLTFNDEPDKADATVYIGINLLACLALLIFPFMPEVGKNMCKQLNIPELYIPDEFEFIIGGGHNIGEPEHLFSRIDEKMIKAWREKYGGVRE